MLDSMLSTCTFTLSTQSMFRFSGIVVIHSPVVRRKNIPCSAANHKLYSAKFCRTHQSTSRMCRCKSGCYVKAETLSRTLLSLPLRTIIVVFGSSQSLFRGSFKSGCNLRSISLNWSILLPWVSRGSVSVALNPCQTYYSLNRRISSRNMRRDTRIMSKYQNE